jgi:hypothetical protein
MLKDKIEKQEMKKKFIEGLKWHTLTP